MYQIGNIPVMTAKRVSQITESIRVSELRGSGDPEISRLVYDSRDAGPGALFFALKGIHTDGHSFIPAAIESGTPAIVHSDPLPRYEPGIIYIRVENTRQAMSPAAAAFYDHPSREMKIIGVTGTDGKSTTVSFIHQLLTGSGKKAGFLSTVSFNLGETTEKNHLRQSTPEATEIQRLLREMVKRGCSHAVVESTSHGLSPQNNRLGDVEFDIGVLTNISHEHLEFHKTLERYMDDKANLFRMLPPESGFAVINGDDPRKEVFLNASRAPAGLYSLKDRSAAFFAGDITRKEDTQSFTLYTGSRDYPLQLNQPGLFNIENLLAALMAVSALPGETLEEYLTAVPDLKPVKGRMVPVDRGQPFRVLVDYAHTPGSFEKLFPVLRRETEGKLIALFSSAGERDLEKRPQLGAIASRYCDIIVLADEDPRGEPPRQVLDDVAAGCRLGPKGELILIEDRPTAIRRAFSIARRGDLVVLLGKGHEGSIIYADGPIPWDEEEEAVKALEWLGYPAT